MTSRKTIGLDADGVLYNFVGAACEWSGFEYEKATSFDIFEAWGAPGLWPQFDKHAQSTGFCLGLNLLPGAQQFVTRLLCIADVLIVTSPYRDAPTWAYERERALKRDFGLERDRVMSVRSKQYANVDVLIDDRPSNIETFPGPGVIFDQPWNRECTAGIRACGYDAAIVAVREILG